MIPERKWICDIGGQFCHLKRERNSGQAEIRDIYFQCLPFSMYLLLGNNQGYQELQGSSPQNYL